ncbi:Bax inhibitor-1/YccA family protein [Desulfoplanes sp.]
MADFRTATTRTAPQAEVLNAFMRGVYQWMAGGLALTAITAYLVASSPALVQAIFGNQILFWGLIIAEFGLVMGISAGISKLSASTASGLFLLYSGLNGVTLSAILLAYTGNSVVGTFVICAGMFGAMSVYGMVTKKDLTSLGSFMFMGLVGIILASIVNIFLRSPGLEFAISGIGVLVFVGLTAYDTQKLKEMGQSAPMDDGTAVRRGTILGALTLYLDFINLFLMLLRFFGQGRD